MTNTSLHSVQHNETPREKARLQSLLQLVPHGHRSLLDVGTRDGYILQHLLPRFEEVTALDLERPALAMDQVICVSGDATRLQFPDNSFDVVLCSEVLEHVPSAKLADACRELSRVARHCVVIGVPYRQDLRVDRVTCPSCGLHGHAWGHVNTFDERRLRQLFAGLKMAFIDFVGTNKERTNLISSALFDRAGNPWGAYNHNQKCTHCGAVLASTGKSLSFTGKLSAYAGHFTNTVQKPFTRPSPTWIHTVFEKSRP